MQRGCIDITMNSILRFLKMRHGDTVVSRPSFKVNWGKGLPVELWEKILVLLKQAEFRKVNKSFYLPRIFYCIDAPTQVSAVNKFFYKLVEETRQKYLKNKYVIKTSFFFAISDIVDYIVSNRLKVDNDQQIVFLVKNTPQGRVVLCNVILTYEKENDGYKVKLTYGRGLPENEKPASIMKMAMDLFNKAFGIRQTQDGWSSTIELRAEYTIEIWDRTPEDRSFIEENKKHLKDEVFARLGEITGSDFD